MITERTESKPITDDDIKKALAIKSAACYGALVICRGLNGAKETNEWWLARNHTLVQLGDEAERRKIDLSNVVTNVEHRPLLRSVKYLHSRGQLDDAYLQRWWNDVKAGRIEP